MIPKYLIITILAATAIFFSAKATAQNVTAITPLAFGEIYPGIPKAISKNDAGAAAEFLITGIAGDEMIIEFSLPTYLNSGSNNMQLIFTETSCAMDSSSSPDQSNPGYDNLDPWHAITYRLGANGITVWLGGMIVPGLAQQPGSYSATLVLTVTPTGS